MTALPKIPRPATLIALAVLAVVAGGCGKTAVRAPNVIHGTFTDSRDGQTYRTVKIGEETWMAENLNFVTDSSVCYGNADSNCTKYGRLYKWDDAMKACPAGWRLPGDEDWDSLAVAVGGVRDEEGHWEGAGRKLKSKSGWNYNDDGNISGNGTDDYDFSALPGGSGWYGDFYSAGNKGFWWSATEVGVYGAWGWHMYYDNANVGWNYDLKVYSFSLRCVEDIAK